MEGESAHKWNWLPEAKAVLWEPDQSQDVFVALKCSALEELYGGYLLKYDSTKKSWHLDTRSRTVTSISVQEKPEFGLTSSETKPQNRDAIPFSENVFHTAVLWISAICQYHMREHEIILAAQRLLSLEAEHKVNEAIVLMSHYNGLFKLPIIVRDPSTGAIVRGMKPALLAHLQVQQATGTVVGPMSANWSPCDVYVEIKLPADLPSTMFRMHLATENDRLSVNYECSDVIPRELPTTTRCVFRHILPTNKRVVLVMEAGTESEHGMALNAVGFANVSSALKPRSQSNEDHSQKILMKLFTTKAKPPNGLSTLHRRLVSGAASGLKIFHARPVEVNVKVRRTLIMTPYFPPVKSLLPDCLNLLRQGEFLHASYKVLRLEKSVIRGSDSSPDSSLWIRIVPTDKRSPVAEGEEVGLSVVLPVEKHHSIELYRKEKLLGSARVKNSSGTADATFYDVATNGEPLVVGSIQVECIVVSQSTYPPLLELMFSDSEPRLRDVVSSFTASQVDTRLWFDKLLKRFTSLASEDDSTMVTAAAPALIRLLLWVSEEENEYLIQPQLCEDSDLVNNLVRAFTNIISDSSYVVIEDALELLPCVGRLVRSYLPGRSHATAILPLTHSLVKFFQSSVDDERRRLQVICLDGLERLYFAPTDESGPASELETQLFSILDCVHPIDEVAVAFYRLIARLGQQMPSEGGNSTALTSRIHRWTVPFWKSRSRTISEIRAVSGVLSFLPTTDQFTPGLATLILTLLPVEASVAPKSFFPGFDHQVGKEIIVSKNTSNETLEAALELCVVLESSTTSLTDPNILLALAKTIVEARIDGTWVSLYKLLYTKALNFLRLALKLCMDTAGSTIPDKTDFFLDAIICAMNLAKPHNGSNCGNLLTSFVLYHPEGSLQLDALELVAHAWNQLDLQGQSLLDSSTTAYSLLLYLGLACRGENTRALDLISRILIERMAVHWAVMEGDLSAFGELLVRAFDQLCVTEPLRSVNIGPLFSRLKTSLSEDRPIVYRRALDGIEKAFQLRLTVQLLPASLLARQEYLARLLHSGYELAYRSTLESILISHDHDTRALGMAYLLLAESYNWDKQKMVPDRQTPALPEQSEYERRLSLTKYAAELLDEGNFKYESLVVRHRLINDLTTLRDYKQVSVEALEFSILCDKKGTPETEPRQRYYLIEFKPNVPHLGCLSGRNYIYYGGQRHLGSTIESLRAEFEGSISEEAFVPYSNPLSYTVSEVNPAKDDNLDRHSSLWEHIRFMRDKPGSEDRLGTGAGVSRLFYRISETIVLSLFSPVQSVRKEHVSAMRRAMEDLNTKTAQLSALLSPENLRHLELVLVGVIHAPLNGGIQEYALYQEEPSFQECFSQFKGAVEKALEFYGAHIPESLQAQYQFLCTEFRDKF